MSNNKKKSFDFKSKMGNFKKNKQVNNVVLEIKDEEHISELEIESSSPSSAISLMSKSNSKLVE